MVRPPIFKRPAILALAIIPLALTLSSCSNNDVQQNGADIAQQIEGQNSKTQAKGVSAVGTWGPKEGAQEWDTDPWIAFTKDGNFSASNSGFNTGGSIIMGTWSQNGSSVDLVIIGESGVNNSAGPEMTTADRAETSKDAIELYSSRGEKIVTIPFSTENPLLMNQMISDAVMQKGASIADCIEGQNVSSSKNANPDCTGRASTETKRNFSDTSYTGRYNQ